MKHILVSGSIAYDHIMNVHDQFSNHIIPEQIDTLSVSFLLHNVEKYYGGTAQNIAYNLGLLEHKAQTIMVGQVGYDFVVPPALQTYIDYGHIIQHDDILTAAAYIMTDTQNNQITGFHPGALGVNPDFSISDKLENTQYCFVAPNPPETMLQHLTDSQQAGIPCFFDPGQNITAFTKAQLLHATKIANYLIVNTYERALMQKHTGLDDKDLMHMYDTIIVTHGARGVEILNEHTSLHIDAVPVNNIVDPTGAGDACRAGLLKGLAHNLSREDSIKIGCCMATYVIQKTGTMEHTPTLDEIKQCYIHAYNTIRPLG